MTQETRPASRKLRAMETQTEQAASEFESFVRKGISDIREMLTGFEEALEFQSRRTTVLEQKVEPLERKVSNLDSRMQSFEQRVQQIEFAENKLERFSRRNNFRIVGVPQLPNENPMQVATNLLKDLFGLVDPKIERAHRDGPQLKNLPRHLLVKMLSYQDKRYIVSQQRAKLEKEKFYIIDDLTKKDREEKRKWKKEVQQAFQAGIRYHFSAGRWRDGRGIPAAFYAAATGPGSTTIHPLDTRDDTPHRTTRFSSASSSGNRVSEGRSPHIDPAHSPTVTYSHSDDTPPPLTRIVTAMVHTHPE